MALECNRNFIRDLYEVMETVGGEPIAHFMSGNKVFVESKHHGVDVVVKVDGDGVSVVYLTKWDPANLDGLREVPHETCDSHACEKFTLKGTLKRLVG